MDPTTTLADLHIHSHFSRATSRDLTMPSLLAWAQRKGLGLLGTGDWTHPGWRAEIRDALEEDGSGFLSPRAALRRAVDPGVPLEARREVRFVLSAEVSSIWKQGGRVRKVHSVVFVPTLEAAERYASLLGRLGNLASDGRPILGVEPRRLLSLAKEVSPDAFLLPAHVWTPHFAIFGAMSGFDSLEECFGDLSGEVVALETGLSSDTLMNRRWSALDRFSMVSSSDAHSPSRLGREATLLSGVRSFTNLVAALRGEVGPASLRGTVEFFPEEGKYHLDGHRTCGIRTIPSETRRLEGRCPSCGGRLTPGVLGRVEALADRPVSDEAHRRFPPQHCLIPLAEILGELAGTGPGSKAVAMAYERAISQYGGEVPLLGWADPAALAAAGDGLLALALRRMRAGRVRLEPGYDGRPGVASLFRPGEIASLRGQAGGGR